jgi:spermidine/putrescine transport system substrate-binding protein
MKRMLVCILGGLLGLNLILPFFCFAQNKNNEVVLKVYNWEDYFDKDIIKGFEESTGIKVDLETFDNEEQMFSEIQSHLENYDVIIVSSDILSQMIEMRLLSELDLAEIPNLRNIDKRFVGRKYDPGNKYSVPYMWGITGLVVNREFIKENIDSWQSLWDVKYKGKVALLSDSDEIMNVGLLAQGFSLNSTDSAQLELAANKLLAQGKLVSGYFDIKTLVKKASDGEIWLAQAYNGDVMFAAQENKALEFIVPKEGSVLWVDNFVISRDVKNKKQAMMFINYMLDAKVSAMNANYLWYANCNIAAAPFTSKEIINSPVLYPPQEIFERCKLFSPEGGEKEKTQRIKLINKLWSRLQLRIGSEK